MNENSINNEEILIMVKNNKLRIFSLYIIKINKVYLIESYDVWWIKHYHRNFNLFYKILIDIISKLIKNELIKTGN